ncbi:MAG: trypsin-like peptidase domain-containing protein [Nitrolancea sp.]
MFSRVSICALLLALIVLPACGSNSGKSTTTSSGKGSTAVAVSSATAAPAASPTAATPKAAADLTWEQIIELLTPSTVMIRTDVPPSAVSNEALYSGTGIVMDTNGYILTNAHVVNGASALSVYISGSSKERSARIVGVSPCDDLAVIKVDDTTGLKPATFGTSSGQHVGEDVAAMGYPLAFDIGTDISISRGIISKLDQTLEPFQNLIQTDAAVNRGNSGGPLVNTKGQVIGINTLSFDEALSATGINYAISIDQAQKVAPDLQAGHNRLFLGMNLGPNDYSDYFGTDQGLVVEAVASDSPASVAGVQQAFLLTSLAGLPVNSMADVCKILRSHQDGDALKVEFLNITSTDQQYLSGEVVIGKSTSTTKVTVVDTVPLAGTEPTPTTSSGSSGSTGSTQQFQWDFASDDGDWPTGDSDNLTVAVGGNAYTITFKQPNVYQVFSPQSVPNATDQAVQADVTLQGAAAGLVVRFSSDSNHAWTYYGCYIAPNDNYDCGVRINDTWTSLVDPTPSQAIKDGQVNTLLLSAVGSTITFKINGTQVASFNDSQVAAGYVGVEADTTTDATGVVVFTNASAAVIPQ